MLEAQSQSVCGQQKGEAAKRTKPSRAVAITERRQMVSVLWDLGACLAEFDRSWDSMWSCRVVRRACGCWR